MSGLKLNPTEQKMVDAIRRREIKWALGRWISLVFGFLLLACMVGIYIPLLKITASDPYQYLFLWPIIYPISMVLCGMIVWIVIQAVRDWQGNATRTLLLKIIDHLQSEAREDAKKTDKTTEDQ